MSISGVSNPGKSAIERYYKCFLNIYEVNEKGYIHSNRGINSEINELVSIVMMQVEGGGCRSTWSGRAG